MGVRDLFEAGNRHADLSDMVFENNGFAIKADGLVHSAKVSCFHIILGEGRRVKWERDHTF